MSKGRAFTWFIGCGLAAFVCFGLCRGTFGASAVVCGMSALIATACFFCLWLGKYIRDADLKQRSAVKDESEAIHPVITSPGSSRLFVPEPLDRQ